MTTVISVRFRSGCKTYFFDPGDVQVQTGDHVIVETAQGLEYATVYHGQPPGGRLLPSSSPCGPWSGWPRKMTAGRRPTTAPGKKEAFDICQKKIAASTGWR